MDKRSRKKIDILCKRTKKLIERLTNLRDALQKDHMKYAENKKNISRNEKTGGEISVMGSAACLVTPAAPLVAAGAAVSGVSGLLGLYNSIAENAAHRTIMKEVNRELGNYSDLLKMLSAKIDDELNKALAEVSVNKQIADVISILSSGLCVTSLVLTTTKGIQLVGKEALKYLSPGAIGSLVSIGFSLYNETANETTVKMNCELDQYGQISNIIDLLEVKVTEWE